MMRIHTVAAGGGSILHYEGGRFRVGPDSAGSDPGPACYGRGGPLTVTDVAASGTITVERESESSETTVAGQKVPTPDTVPVAASFREAVTRPVGGASLYAAFDGSFFTDDKAVGAANAVKASGKDIIVVGYNGDPEEIQAFMQGARRSVPRQ